MIRNISLIQVISVIAGCDLWAAIPKQQIDLDLNVIKRVEKIEKGMDQKTVALIIPNGLKSGESDVGNKIVDHSVNSFFQTDYFKNSEIGKTTSKIESKLRPDVSLGKSEDTGVEHKLGLQIEPAQQEALVKYTGYFEGKITWVPNRQEYRVDVNRRIGSDSVLVLDQVNNSIEGKTEVSVRWDF